MVLLTIQGAEVYHLLDRSGRSIGTVHRSVSNHIVGKGAGTVLLTRSMPGMSVERVTARIPALIARPNERELIAG